MLWLTYPPLVFRCSGQGRFIFPCFFDVLLRAPGNIGHSFYIMCLYTTSLFNTNYVLKTHLAFTQTSLKFLIQTRSQTHVYIKYVLHVFTPNSFSTNELSHPYGRPSQRNAPAKSSKAAGATHHWIVWEDFQTKPTRRQIELT